VAEDRDSLPLPPAGEVTSTPLGAARDPRQIPAIIMFTAFASGTVARWLKLPIEWVAPMVLARDTGGDAGVSGWYAILISAVMVVFRFGPVWLLREPAPKSAPAVPPPPIPAGKPGPSDAR
jgi:hypothetical protein